MSPSKVTNRCLVLIAQAQLSLGLYGVVCPYYDSIVYVKQVFERAVNIQEVNTDQSNWMQLNISILHGATAYLTSITQYNLSLIYRRMLGYAVGLVMHVTNAVNMANTFKGEVLEDADVRRFHDDQWKFLTIWNVYMQMSYCALGLSCDALSLTNEGKASLLVKTLKRIRDPLFSSFIFPMTFTVFTVFWCCFSYERSYILPPSVDKTLSWTANHVIHTAIVPVVLWEILYRPRRTPETHVLNLVLMYSYASAYLVVLVDSYITSGSWVYPILNLLDSTIYQFIFFVISVVLVQTFYILQWHLTDLIWGRREDLKRIN